MSKITIRERQQRAANGFAATVTINHQAQYDIMVRNPFEMEALAQQMECSAGLYGEQLFKQVFAETAAYADYAQAFAQRPASVWVEVECISPGFQALYWEVLKDPKRPKTLAAEGAFSRLLRGKGGARWRIFQPASSFRKNRTILNPLAALMV